MPVAPLRRTEFVEAKALALAVADELRLIDESGELDVAAGFCEEAQFQVAIASLLRSKEVPLVLVEKPYPDEGWHERCDVWAATQPPTWIEIKKAYRGNGPGWNNKPAEQLQGLLWDCAKLLRVADDDHRCFVLTLFYNQPATPFDAGCPRFTSPAAKTLEEELLRWTAGGTTWRQLQPALGIPPRLAAAELLPVYATLLSILGRSASTIEPVKTALGQLEYAVVTGEVLRQGVPG